MKHRQLGKSRAKISMLKMTMWIFGRYHVHHVILAVLASKYLLISTIHKLELSLVGMPFILFGHEAKYWINSTSTR